MGEYDNITIEGIDFIMENLQRMEAFPAYCKHMQKLQQNGDMTYKSTGHDICEDYLNAIMEKSNYAFEKVLEENGTRPYGEVPQLGPQMPHEQYQRKYS